jgi:fructose-1,6-bisphosphatase I
MYRLNKQNEFIFQKEIHLGEKGKLNAPGATQKGWSKEHKALVDAIFQDGYRLRYSGGMVPDLHQILLKGGGLFSYPSTSDVPKGKLRMIFEVFPFAFVFEKAGGMAIDGKNRLLDLAPMHPHDTTPCFFGSNEEIKRVLSIHG